MTNFDAAKAGFLDPLSKLTAKHTLEVAKDLVDEAFADFPYPEKLRQEYEAQLRAGGINTTSSRSS